MTQSMRSVSINHDRFHLGIVDRVEGRQGSRTGAYSELGASAAPPSYAGHMAEIALAILLAAGGALTAVYIHHRVVLVVLWVVFILAGLALAYGLGLKRGRRAGPAGGSPLPAPPPPQPPSAAGPTYITNIHYETNNNYTVNGSDGASTTIFNDTSTAREEGESESQ
jgi:hypothetical protein